jgi:hypothetical protein
VTWHWHGNHYGTHFCTQFGNHFGTRFGTHFDTRFGTHFGINFGSHFELIWSTVISSKAPFLQHRDAFIKPLFSRYQLFFGMHFPRISHAFRTLLALTWG